MESITFDIFFSVAIVAYDICLAFTITSSASYVIHIVYYTDADDSQSNYEDTQNYIKITILYHFIYL